jgi:RNA polymerase sigma-70 factor (ECF subfamily)
MAQAEGSAGDHAASQPERGGGAVLHELFDRYRPALYAYFLRRTRQPADAEDLTHDVFLRLSRLDPATEIHNIEAFIFRTAVNLLRDRARRDFAHRDVTEMLPTDPEPVAGEPTAERVLEAKVELKRVMDALGALSEKTRHIFILRRLEQMKCEDIASFYGISVSAVEQHITKALAHLAKTVGRP